MTSTIISHGDPIFEALAHRMVEPTDFLGTEEQLPDGTLVDMGEQHELFDGVMVPANGPESLYDQPLPPVKVYAIYDFDGATGYTTRYTTRKELLRDWSRIKMDYEKAVEETIALMRKK